MGFFRSGFSAIGRLVSVVILLTAFMAGMSGVVYISLSGSEIKVPEIVGKDFVESEKELAALGLKIKKRADRASSGPINMVLEQLPRAGETVKSGQMILVVVSKAGEEAADKPKSLIEGIEADDTEKIEEMISDRPKRSRANTNSNANDNRKKPETTRDVVSNTAASPANTVTSANTVVKPDDPNRRDPGDPPPDRGTQPSPTPRSVAQPSANRPPSGETRPRSTPRP